MLVYRVITQKELTNYKNGQIIIENHAFGKNTHQYEQGIDYLHFFEFPETAKIYQENVMDKQFITSYIIRCEIDNSILEKYRGYGYYYIYNRKLDPCQKMELIPIPEYAIPVSFFSLDNIIEVSDTIKLSWLNSNLFFKYINQLEINITLKEYITNLIYDYKIKLKSTYSKDGVNKKAENTLFNQKKFELQEQISKELYTIEMYTLYNRSLKTLLTLWLRRLIEIPYYNLNYLNIKYIPFKKYIYNENNNIFPFYRLEHYIKNIISNKKLAHKIILDLQKTNRYKDFYLKNIIISSNLANSNLVVGNIQMKHNLNKLHCWVEYKNYVIDYSKNIIIPKSDYYKLTKASKIDEISSSSLKNICKALYSTEIIHDAKFLALFGKELLNDYNKNICVLTHSPNKHN